MHDIKFIREDPEVFDAGLARRGLEPQAAAILSLDAERRAVATLMQEAQSRRNDASKLIGAARVTPDLCRRRESRRFASPLGAVPPPRLIAERHSLLQALREGWANLARDACAPASFDVACKSLIVASALDAPFRIGVGSSPPRYAPSGSNGVRRRGGAPRPFPRFGRAAGRATVGRHTPPRRPERR